MTPRDNWLSLVRRQGFESIPPEFNLCPSLLETFRRETGAEWPAVYFEFPLRGIQAGFGWGNPPRREPVPAERWREFYPSDLQQEAHFDGWGVAHEKGSDAAHHMTRMRHPLEQMDGIAEMEQYPWPAYTGNTFDIDGMRRRAEEVRAEGFVPSANMGCTIWERSWYLRSMERLMMDMAAEENEAAWLLDRITGYACATIAAYAEAGAEHVHLGDDVGMQKTVMMSEEMYRTWLKPRLAKVIRSAKEINPNLVISYHSCGYVLPFIEDFIELGIDILNPIQPECMPFAEVFARHGGHISFWGTIGTQTTMPFGSPEEVKAEVKRNLDIAGPAGGLWPTPTHLLEPEVPWANVLAYVEACREYEPARA